MAVRNATVSMMAGEDLECHNFVISGVDMGAIQKVSKINAPGKANISSLMEIVYWLWPWVRLYQWQYHRQALNPKYTKYRAYLRRRK